MKCSAGTQGALCQPPDACCVNVLLGKDIEQACHIQVVVASGQGNVAYLEVQHGKLNQAAHHKLDVEVACVDITPIGESCCYLLCLYCSLLHACHFPCCALQSCRPLLHAV